MSTKINFQVNQIDDTFGRVTLQIAPFSPVLCCNVLCDAKGRADPISLANALRALAEDLTSPKSEVDEQLSV